MPLRDPTDTPMLSLATLVLRYLSSATRHAHLWLPHVLHAIVVISNKCIHTDDSEGSQQHFVCEPTSCHALEPSRIEACPLSSWLVVQVAKGPTTSQANVLLSRFFQGKELDLETRSGCCAAVSKASGSPDATTSVTLAPTSHCLMPSCHQARSYKNCDPRSPAGMS